MKLRQKTLLLIGLTLAGLIGVLYASLSTIFQSSFAELEERNAHQNLRLPAYPLGTGHRCCRVRRRAARNARRIHARRRSSRRELNPCAELPTF